MSSTISLGNYIDSFKYEISPPGQDLYPNMTDDEAIGRLCDAFWEMRMTGFDFLAQWTCDTSGNIAPQSAGVPSAGTGAANYIPAGWYMDDNSGALGREIVQAIILFAGYRVALTAMMNATTLVENRAGPVSQTVQKSAQVFQAVLKALTAKIDIVLTRLSDLGSTNVEVLDAVIDNTCSIASGDQWWVR